LQMSSPLPYRRTEFPGLAARCYTWHKSNGWLAGGKRHVPEAARLARGAVELGNDDAGALCAGGFALAWVAGDLDTGAAFIDQALVINPNLAPGWHFSSQVRIFFGEPDMAINHFKQAMRLSPFDPLIGRMRAATTLALFFAGRYGEASSWAEKALREQPNDLSALRAATACYGIAGRLDEARKSLAHLRALDPSLSAFPILQIVFPFAGRMIWRG
jgi:tetratricopeptide (TPR) repeat protein